MTIKNYTLLSLFMVCILSLIYSSTTFAEKESRIREPNWAGKFYPTDSNELTRSIRNLTTKVGKSAQPLPKNGKVKALIMPHAGYIYSGLAAAHSSLVLSRGQFKKVILIGPDHHLGVVYGMVSGYRSYRTPLGKIPLHRDAYRLVSQSPLFRKADSQLDQREHSLEVLLPFLQYYLKSFELVPIIQGGGDVSQISKTLAAFIDQDTLLVISSDLSHYLDYDSAVQKDGNTIKHILNLEGDSLEPGLNQACGLYPLKLLIRIARDLDWQPRLVHYANSGDTAGGKDRVVGYATIAFYESAAEETGGTTMENKKDRELPESGGRILLALARQTIAEKTGREVSSRQREMVAKGLKDKELQRERGTFVTLTKNGNLRGCIGNIKPMGAIVEGVRQNAIQAAFGDPRFQPLRPEEFDEIEIEVSILTEPQRLDYLDGADLLKKLRPHVDGVIIRAGMAGATFLPQVWEKLPDPEDFLGNLCLKAGLPSTYWQTGKPEIETYQVQYFSE